MSDAIQAVWVTGLFTVSGVVVTAAIAGIGSILRRRWAVQDARREAVASERRELRILRRDAYAEVLTGFNRMSNLSTELAAKISAGTAPRVTELENTHRAYVDYINEHHPLVEELDALTFRALVVASDPVAKLIRQVEDELLDEFARAAAGISAKRSGHVSDYSQRRNSLIDAMRAELSAINVVASAG